MVRVGIGDDRIRDGFPGQRMTVLPRPLVRRALSSYGTSALVVTDAGYFPHADRHGRDRPQGAPQLILIFCARGAGWVESARARSRVRAGEFVIIRPEANHAYGADDADPWTVWWMHLDGSLVNDWLVVSDLTEPVSVRSLGDLTEPLGLVQQIIRRMQTDVTPASMLAAAGAAWHLLTLLLVSQVRPDSATESVQSAARYLREHFADPVSVSELAAMARLSTSHFSAIFRAEVGQSVQAYRTDVRMARARELLDTTPIPVSEIARMVGYDDAFYFTRQFKKTHGVAPTIYRSQRKG